MEMPSLLVNAFPPSARTLLDHIRPNVDDAMLTFIARADYGQMATEMFVQLRPIRDTGVIPTPMGWLSEVLELTRWTACQTEAPHMGPSPEELRCHQTRLFACATLLLANDMPACRYSDPSPDSTLAQCLSSTQVLGKESSHDLACFLTWKLSHTEIQGEEMLLFAFGLLLLAIRLRSQRFTDHELGEVAEWVLAQEGRLRQAHRWLYEANIHNPMPALFSLQQGLWNTLAVEFKNNAATILSDEIRSRVLLCGLLIETD